MPHKPFIRVAHLALAVIFVLGLSSCVAYRQPYDPGYVRYAPPPASVAYYDYWYYPDAQVYFDTQRRVYFYFTNQRWVETRVLPSYWRSRLHGYVPIHSRNARPYLEYREHSRKYPPRDREEYREHERDRDRYTPRNRNDVYPRDYNEMPRKEPPANTIQQIRIREGLENRGQAHPDSRIKSPVRQGSHEMPRKQPMKSVKQRAYEKAKAKKDQKNAKHKDKNKKSRRSNDEDQQDDQRRDRDRRDYYR